MPAVCAFSELSPLCFCLKMDPDLWGREFCNSFVCFKMHFSTAFGCSMPHTFKTLSKEGGALGLTPV